MKYLFTLLAVICLLLGVLAIFMGLEYFSEDESIMLLGLSLLAIGLIAGFAASVLNSFDRQLKATLELHRTIIALKNGEEPTSATQTMNDPLKPGSIRAATKLRSKLGL
jgi:Cu/Ag efflux pump CusA